MLAVHPITTLSLTDLPDDIFPNIFNFLDSNTLIRTSTLSKRWLALTSTEEDWQLRCLQQFPYLRKNPSHSWRKHYVLNVIGHRLRNIVQIGSDFYGTMGASIYSLPKWRNGEINSQATQSAHQNAITCFALNQEQNKTRLITASSDKTIVWYKYQYFTQHSIHYDFQSPPTALKCTDSGFISAGSEGNLNYWTEHGSSKLEPRVINGLYQASVLSQQQHYG